MRTSSRKNQGKIKIKIKKKSKGMGFWSFLPEEIKWSDRESRSISQTIASRRS
jgi:hypothetical protein